MNIDVDVLVNEQKVASKRSWMSYHLDYRYPAILVYDVKANIFLDQISYQPGPIQIAKKNQVNGTHNIPEEFRLEFHLTLDQVEEQPAASDSYWNILQGMYSIILNMVRLNLFEAGNRVTQFDIEYTFKYSTQIIAVTCL